MLLLEQELDIIYLLKDGVKQFRNLYFVVLMNFQIQGIFVCFINP